MNRKEPWEGCTPVVYHLPKFSRKSGWKVNGIRLFGSFYRKISGSNKTSEKVVLFFPDGIFQTEIRVPYLQSHLWNRVQAFAVVFGKWNWFVQMVNAMPGRNLPGLNFAYHLWTVARKDKTLPWIQKHFPESKTRPRILGNLFGFWEVFSILRSVFVFWDVFWILGSVFGFWKVFCNVGSVLSLWTTVWTDRFARVNGKQPSPSVSKQP